jgi:membrane protease YdiL (CAAX protease family)
LLNPDPPVLLRLLLLAPLLEEWIVRAGLQEWLMRHDSRPGAAGVTLTVLLPAVGFSLLHLGSGWHAAAGVFLPGLALGLIYRRWRDWRLCALVHALLNGFALAVCALNIY